MVTFVRKSSNTSTRLLESLNYALTQAGKTLIRPSAQPPPEPTDVIDHAGLIAELTSGRREPSRHEAFPGLDEPPAVFARPTGFRVKHGILGVGGRPASHGILRRAERSYSACTASYRGLGGRVFNTIEEAIPNVGAPVMVTDHQRLVEGHPVPKRAFEHAKVRCVK